MATKVYAEYDRQVNNEDSCDFSGTAHKEYVLNDGDVGDVGSGDCMIVEGTSSSDICGAVQWACYDQSYTDVIISSKLSL